MQALAAFNSPSSHYFPTRELRRRWASLLHYCDSASAHEDPLYALYGEIFSTLSALIVPHDLPSVEPTITNSIFFSYPQCHLVRKHRYRIPRSGLDREMYTIPDFAFMHIKIAYATDGASKVEKESVVFLTEIKRLYDDSLERQLQFTDSGESSVASISTFARTIRQLLLQAFCCWHVFNQPSVYLKFICGVYFTLIKFTRPHQLSPLPILAATTGEKRKYDELVNTISAIKNISNAEIAQWVPEDSVEVIYWNKLVSDNPGNPELHLSAPFRSGLRLCLEGASSQPSDVFDVIELQPDIPSDVTSGKEMVSEWYSEAARPSEPSTPSRTNGPLHPDGNSSSPEQVTLTPYKDRPVDVPPLRIELRGRMARTLGNLKS